MWSGRPETRQLPSLWQWVQIRWLTQKKNWTPPQRKMMGRASRYQAVRGLGVAVVLALIGWGVYEGHGTLQANALRDRLLDANTNEVPGIVQDMPRYRRWLNPLLHDAYAQAEKVQNRRKQLHTSLALLPVDASRVNYLKGRLLDAGAGEVAVIRDALFPHKDQLLGELWRVVESPEKGKESQRLRAAAALAKYDPESEKWTKASILVVADLVRENPVYLLYWSAAFRPVRETLVAPLSDVFRDKRPERAAERSLAANLLADYAADNPATLADLLMAADKKQFAIIFPKFKEQGQRGLPVLIGEIDRKLPPDAKDEAKENLAKRQANAAVALLRMDQAGIVWPLLKQRSDPRVRSYLIHRFGPLGADAQALVTRLADEPDVTIRRAVILSLGPEEFGAAAWTPEAQQRLVPQLQELYRTAADPGLHAATEWLLRTWQQESWLKQVNEEWAKDKVKGDGWWVVGKDKDSSPATRHPPPATPKWYVNSQGQTMVIIPGPVEFLMGSPSTEQGRDSDEPQHKRRIGRTFAIAAKAVTVEQYRKFKPSYVMGEMEQKARTADSPVISTDWFQATEYCNWLSQQEGLPESEWCYEPLRDRKALPALAASSVGLLAGSFGPLAATGGLDPRRTDPEYKLARNHLQRRGYRLPTEAEWEYACRAGAVTSRYFGETEELLQKYAWYDKNAQDRTWPVGSKKPNDLGLFDMHGNVWTWCQEKYQKYLQPQGEKAIEYEEDILSIKMQDDGLLRGGSFHAEAVYVRSAFRHRGLPTDCPQDVGFRPARTFAP